MNKYKYLMSLLLCVFTQLFLSCTDNNNKGEHRLVFDSIDNGHYVTKIDSTEYMKDTSNKVLSEFIVINEDFEYILNTLIEEYNKCKNKEKGHHFTITIGEFKDEKYMDIKIFSICESFYKGFVSYYDDFISDGYGFFYYKDYLFILYGLQLDNILKKTGKAKTFSYKQVPPCIFDPPRWYYYYWEKEFYVVEGYASPCGG